MIDGLGNALKDSALKQKDNFTEMLEAILEQKKQSSDEILHLKNKLLYLDERENNFKDALRGEKFKDYIKLLLTNLEKLDSLELKSLIRTLIPRAIIHLGGTENKLELIYNFDVKTPPVRRTGGMEVFLHGQDGVIPLFPNPSYSEQIKGGGQEDKKWPYIKSGRGDRKLDEPISTSSYVSIFITHFLNHPKENCGILRKLYLDFDLSIQEIVDLTDSQWKKTAILEAFKDHNIKKASYG